MPWENKYTTLLLAGRQYGKEALLAKADSHAEVPFWSFIQEWLSDKDTVTVQTSGSTGKPKSIRLHKEQMVQSALATGTFFQLKKGDKALLCLSCDYIAGKMMLVRAFVLGLDIYRAAAQYPWQGWKGEMAFAAMVPAQVSKTLAEAPDTFQRLEHLIIGGAPVSPTLLSYLQEVSTRCYATYGMTETITHIAVRRLNHPELENHYKALPNVRLEQDERGCLVIHAPKVAEEAIVTNDVVDWLSPNAFRWLGRWDNVVNSGGVKLHPEQIEDKLKDLFPYRYFMIGERDEKWGEKLVLVLETAAFSASEQAFWMAEMSKRLDPYEIPKKIRFRELFSETGSGKIKRD